MFSWFCLKPLKPLMFMSRLAVRCWQADSPNRGSSLHPQVKFRIVRVENSADGIARVKASWYMMERIIIYHHCTINIIFIGGLFFGDSCSTLFGHVFWISVSLLLCFFAFCFSAFLFFSALMFLGFSACLLLHCSPSLLFCFSLLLCFFASRT